VQKKPGGKRDLNLGNENTDKRTVNKGRDAREKHERLLRTHNGLELADVLRR
jgi:hypothetical protein